MYFMRKYVQVWKGPTPSSIAEAKAFGDNKFRVRGGEGLQELAELAALMWARYPYDIKTVDHDPFWLDTRLAEGHDGTELLELYPNPKHIGRLLPEIADEAKRLGLTVFDEERLIVFQPSGVVLGNRPAAAHGPVAPEAPPIDPVSPEVQRRLEPALTRAGFVPAPMPGATVYFERTFTGGMHRFGWSVGSPLPKRDLVITLSTRCDEILAGMEQCAPGFTASCAGRVISWPLHGLVIRGGLEFTKSVYPDLTSSIIELTNAPGSDARRLDAIATAVRDLALPALGSAESLAALWQLILDESTLPAGACAAQWDERIPILLGLWMSDARAEAFASARRDHLAGELEQLRAAEPGNARMLSWRERRLAAFDGFLVAVRQVPPPGVLR